jgi:hypothetical protein
MHRIHRILVLAGAILLAALTSTAAQADMSPRDLALGMPHYSHTAPAPPLRDSVFKEGRNRYRLDLGLYLSDEGWALRGEGPYSDPKLDRTSGNKGTTKMIYVRAEIKRQSRPRDSWLDCRYTVFIMTRPGKPDTMLRMVTVIGKPELRDKCPKPPVWFYDVARGGGNDGLMATAAMAADSRPCTAQADADIPAVYEMNSRRAEEAVKRWKAAARRELRNKYDLDPYGITDQRLFYRINDTSCMLMAAINTMPIDKQGRRLPNAASVRCLYDVTIYTLKGFPGKVFARERHRDEDPTRPGEMINTKRCGTIGTPIKAYQTTLGLRRFNIPEDFLR